MLISLGTRSITVSTPYAGERTPLPLLLYRSLGEGENALRRNDVRRDLAYLLQNGYTAVSEQELLAALRREAPLPAQPVVLLFDDANPAFAAEVLPVLQEAELPWFPLRKATALSQELRTAGYPVTRLERMAGIAMEEYDF
ncbi:MAG: hypothetical protein LBS96_05460 [Oscillospiraceae bacterium]|nr:hypothetical protein [Oscillospiraceae bacterium]